MVRSTPDVVIIRAQGLERRETSFVTEEKAEGSSKDLKQSCNICGAWGKYFHFARDCPLKHPKKSVAENIEYFKKNPKALEDKKRKLKEQRESG